MTMQNFRNGLTVAYHATADFLRNPVHAGLVGGIGGAIYLLIGRELLNKQICKDALRDKHVKWHDWLKDKEVFTFAIEERVVSNEKRRETRPVFTRVCGTTATRAYENIGWDWW